MHSHEKESERDINQQIVDLQLLIYRVNKFNHEALLEKEDEAVCKYLIHIANAAIENYCSKLEGEKGLSLNSMHKIANSVMEAMRKEIKKIKIHYDL